ncbi:MAG: hypothetical protein U0794_10940 [Isosphaeraceae bacterium]
MRKTLGVLAVVLACSGGDVRAGGWPSWLSLPSKQTVESYPAIPATAGSMMPPSSCPSCAGGALGHGHAPPVGGYLDENPLYPELAPWLFQKSHCRRLFCTGGCGGGHRRHHWGQGEVPYFPPLPYGHQSAGVPAPGGAAAPQATGFPVN